jgi:hypothetical protein
MKKLIEQRLIPSCIQCPYIRNVELLGSTRHYCLNTKNNIENPYDILDSCPLKDGDDE